MPAVSSQQRRWAFAVKGATWARRHHFDTPGPLPTYVRKKEPMASSTERLASKMASSRKGGNWMAGAVKHPGALHRSLGVPASQKISAKKLAAAANSSNPTLARRARLAQTFAKYRP
jgi:hypothetical protein